MTDSAEKVPPSRAQRRQRVAVLAVVAGVITATFSGFVILVVTFGPSLSGKHADSAIWMTRTVFASFLLCGLVMGIAGWRLAVGDRRGYRPTMAAALAAFLLACVHVVAWVFRSHTLDYALIGLTVPLLTYGAIAYVLMDCPPEPVAPGKAETDDAESPDRPAR